MRVPVDWLREYVPVEMPLDELATKLSVAAAEVEGIERLGVPDRDGNLGLFRVGRVLEAAKHPNADRLQLCRVDVGEGEPVQIVCGAWNFGEGAMVAVALPGAVLPDGMQLEARPVRGETSHGMILAEDEVGLGTDHTGIMVLDDQLEPGTPLADVLPIADDVLVVEATPNRPDLLSIYGIAREVAALYDLELAPPPGVEPERSGDEPVDVQVEDLVGAPRYIGRLFRDVGVGPSPIWLKSRLHAAGMRPISNVVDITNYAMLALGNPLHAFDFETLRGSRVVVRRARARREAPHARRRRARADAGRPDDRGRGALDRARRNHGRRRHGDRRGDDGRASRGSQLRAVLALPLVRAPAPAHRRLEPLGERRRSVPCRAVGRTRDAAPRRARRSALGRPHRRAGRLAGAAGRAFPSGARRRADRHRDPTRRAAGRCFAGSASTSRASR